MENTLLINLANICNKIHERKLANGLSGNVSVRVSDKILITPSGFSLADIQPKDLVVLDIEGDFISGNNKPSSEKLMHLEIYKARPHINCIIHTHSPAATTFAYLNKQIAPVSPESAIFIPKLPIVRFEPYGTKKLAESVSYSLKDCNAVLIEKHGVVTVGSGITQAYNLLVVVEETAIMNIYMSAITNS